MSTVDVMYQPYATYFPYQKSAIQTPENVKKVGTPKMQSCLDAAHVALGQHVKECTTSDRAPQPTHTQYLSANCVLLTYFSGDVSSHVDDHFSRALSQPSNFNAHGQTNKPWKEMSSMGQRNFPPSFWNSNYQPPPPAGHSATVSHPHATDFAFPDPYMHSTLHAHGGAGLHPHDPWHYSYSSQAHTGYTGHGRPLVHHDLTYPSMVGATSRFNPSHYSGLLGGGRLGPSMAGQDPWGKYSHADPLVTHTVTHLDSRAALGIDSQVSEMGKDLYWF